MQHKLISIVLFFFLILLFIECTFEDDPKPSTVENPIISPEGGVCTSAQLISISCSTQGTGIRYTVDGTIPSESHGILYSEPINISDSTTIKAIAFKSGWNNSQVVSVRYDFIGGVIIDSEIDDYSVSILNMPDRILRYNPVIISAQASHEISRIDWYVDAILLQSGLSTLFELGTDLGFGYHNITVIVTSGTVMYSATKDFQVVTSYSINLIDFENGTIPQDFDPETTWTIVSEGADSSAYSLKSSFILMDQSTSAIYSIVPLAGTSHMNVSFDRKVSCSVFDHSMRFYINDVPISPEWKGEKDWTNFEYNIDVSNMTEIKLEWRYSKTMRTAGSGRDSAWVDNIAIELR